MNAMIVMAILAAILYSIFVDGTFFKIFASLALVYTFVTEILLKNWFQNPIRKLILISTWNGKQVRMVSFRHWGP